MALDAGWAGEMIFDGRKMCHRARYRMKIKGRSAISYEAGVGTASVSFQRAKRRATEAKIPSILGVILLDQECSIV